MKERTPITKSEVIAALALMIGGGLAALYTETMQGDLHYYYQLIQSLFHIGFQPETAIHIANMVLGNLSDVATPLAVTGMGASFMAALGAGRKEVLSMGVWSGLLISLFFLIEEVIHMDPSVGSECTLSKWCAGDFGDVLALSVPLISLSILAFRHREGVKTVVRKTLHRE